METTNAPPSAGSTASTTNASAVTTFGYGGSSPTASTTCRWLLDVPDQGLLCDLLWADPDGDVKGWGDNDMGVSYTFGADKVSEF